jgi:hypothetical protein
MKRAAGQAARLSGRFLHALGLLVLTAVSLLGLLLFLVAFRLSLGPIQVPYLASVLATAVSGQGIDIHIQQAALAWGGYRQGGAAPLYLQLGQITASNAAGVELAAVPDARLVFLPAALLGTKAPILVNSADAHFAGSDVGVSLLAALRLGHYFRLSSADLFITLGAGRLGAGGDSLPISGGGFSAHVTPHYVALNNGVLTLRPSGGSAPTITFAGTGQRHADWQGALTVTADQVQAADLGTYWPTALAAQTRAWVTANITAGAARDAKFTFGLAAPPNLSQVALTSAAGGFLGTGLTLTWIPHAQPITDLDGTLTVTGPDQINIAASGGSLGGLRLSDGTMAITGLNTPTQIGAVKVTLAGKIADAIAVLNAPPLSLLRAAPPNLAKATGNMGALVTATLPLRGNLQLADVDLNVAAQLTGVAVPTPLSGLAFSGGALVVHATTRDLTVTGAAQFAGEPATVAAVADFTQRQALRRFTMQTALGPVFLHQYGLDAATELADPVGGTVPASFAVTATGNGETAVLNADLTKARLGIPAFGWSKMAGTAGTLAVTAALDADGGFSALTAVNARAPQLNIQGEAANGTLILATADIGGTVAHGTITPAAGALPWRASFSGPSLSVRAILNPPKGPAAQAAARVTPGAAPAAGPAWQLGLNFLSFRLAAAPAPIFQNFSFAGGGKGGTVLTATAQAATRTGLPVVLSITAAAAHRRTLHLTTLDAGELLRILGAYDDLQGGTLDLAADYGNGEPAAGVVRLSQFRLLQAPAFGKVLQSLTIYGVAEAASGPGLGFDDAIVPFSIARGTLTLDDARAYSASLGFTASGGIALADGACKLRGTIIPAYAINALPGKIPVVGKLFTAEKGGGLFAIRVSITGTLAAPHVTVNPLSALTPGVLRDVFGTSGGGK